MAKHILITRPVEDTPPIIDMVRDNGFIPLVAPMLEIKALDVMLPDVASYQALVFTSVNAVRVVSEKIADRSIPVYCVGPQTAEAVREKGWRVLAEAPTGKDLQCLLKDKRGPIVHFSGQDVACAFADVTRYAVYKAQTINVLGDDCLQHLDDGCVRAVLFFSARTASHFIDLLDQYGRRDKFSTIKALCLGERVVESVRSVAWQDVQCAHTPDREGMRRLLKEL